MFFNKLNQTKPEPRVELPEYCTFLAASSDNLFVLFFEDIEAVSLKVTWVLYMVPAGWFHPYRKERKSLLTKMVSLPNEVMYINVADTK